jgi:quercetin dioxygenase-like cupin family protein
MSKTLIVKEERETGDTQAKPGNMILLNLRKLASFRDEGPGVQILSDTGAARSVLFTFKAGQTLKEHHTSSQIMVQALRGRISFSANGTQVQLQAGKILQLEASVPHSILAQTDAIVLVTMMPSPSYHSLEREVFEGLTPLVTRTTDPDAHQ